MPEALQFGPDDFSHVDGVGQIDLVQGDHPGPILQAAMSSELALDDFQIPHRVASGFVRREVDDMDDRVTTVDVA